MNPRIVLLTNALALLPQDAKDGLFDAVEQFLKRGQAKAEKLVVRISMGICFNVVQGIRELANCPDDDKDQLNPV